MRIFRYLLVIVMFFPVNIFNQVVLSPAEYYRKLILWEGEKFLGLRYRSKVEKSIFDCSGYVKFLMNKIGKKVHRSSDTQFTDGRPVKHLHHTRPGDILVFKGRNPRSNRPGHVGLVHHWSNDTLYFIHSSVVKGVTIDHMHDPYYSKRFIQARDVIGD